MTTLEQAVRRVVADLDAAGVQGALIGGLAVSVRARLRTTRDVDLAVSVPDDRVAEALVFDLRRLGYELYEVFEQTTVKRLATVRFHLPLGSNIACVDLLFASSGIEPEIVAAAECLAVFPDVVVPVAQRGHLIALKLLSVDDQLRLRDRDDLLALLVRGSEDDLRLARAAIALIEERGFHRNRDLGAELERFLAVPRRLGAGQEPET